MGIDETDEPSASMPAGCPFAWCVTEHGATVHPDDEDHRSAGLALPLVYRRSSGPGAARRTTAEVGVVRRLADDEAWLVFDDGESVSVEVPIAYARTLLRAARADPTLAHELELDL